MNHPHHTNTSPAETREDLNALITISALLAHQWRELRMTCLPSMPVRPGVKLSARLIAERAERNLDCLADRANAGLAALNAGDYDTTNRAVGACNWMIAMERALDKTAARLLNEAAASGDED